MRERRQAGAEAVPACFGMAAVNHWKPRNIEVYQPAASVAVRESRHLRSKKRLRQTPDQSPIWQFVVFALDRLRDQGLAFSAPDPRPAVVANLGWHGELTKNAALVGPLMEGQPVDAAPKLISLAERASIADFVIQHRQHPSHHQTKKSNVGRLRSSRIRPMSASRRSSR